MSGFPYPASESYPSDEAHLSYLREYNTRTLPIERSQLVIDDVLVILMGTGLVIAGILSTLIWLKARMARQKIEFRTA